MEDNKKETSKEKKSTTKKVAKDKFADFKKKMDSNKKEPGENFRKFAERIGVPSEKVADFKKYLNTNNGRKRE